MNDILLELATQEQRLQFHHFSAERAWALGSALKQAAEARHAAVAIEITLNSQPLFSYAMAGTTADNLDWCRRKRNVVRRYQRSSWYMKQYYQAKSQAGGSLPEHLVASEYAPFGGSFPLAIRQVGVVGEITVSGLPQQEDHQLIVDVLEAFLSEQEKQY